MFGRSLEETMQVEARLGGTFIPVLIHRCVRFIRENGRGCILRSCWACTCAIHVATLYEANGRFFIANFFIEIYGLGNETIYMLSFFLILVGLNEIGIFRLPGQASRIHQLQDLYNQGEEAAQSPECGFTHSKPDHTHQSTRIFKNTLFLSV